MKQYKAVIYGASAKGIGIAAQLPDQVLVAEKTSLAAREFAGALVMGEGKTDPPSDPSGHISSPLLVTPSKTAIKSLLIKRPSSHFFWSGYLEQINCSMIWTPILFASV